MRLKHPEYSRTMTAARLRPQPVASTGIVVGQRYWRKSDGAYFVVDAVADGSDFVCFRDEVTKLTWSVRRGDVPVLMCRV